ncbi:hypothetical protein SHO565_69120 [Streptomyces sp. HO565]
MGVMVGVRERLAGAGDEGSLAYRTASAGLFLASRLYAAHVSGEPAVGAQPTLGLPGKQTCPSAPCYWPVRAHTGLSRSTR